MVRYRHRSNEGRKFIRYSQFPRNRRLARHTGPHREAPESIRRQRAWGEDVLKSLYCGFHREAVRQGKHG